MTCATVVGASMRGLDSHQVLRFGDFELDVTAYELRRRGRPVKLGRQPMDLLILLVERRRQLVPREEIVERLWGKDVFVDVDTGVNTAISKIRQALRDSADAPAFVETVPGKGYRFVATVDVVPTTPTGSSPPHPAAVVVTSELPVVSAPAPARSTWASTRVTGTRVAIGVLVVAVAASIFAFIRAWNGREPVALAVLPFQNLDTDPERAYLAAGLTDETSASLAQIDPTRLSVKGRTVRYKGTTMSAAEIGRELGVDYLVESSIRAEGSRVRVTVTLIRVSDQQYVWSQTYERESTSLLGLQQDLSSAIAEQVSLRLSPDRLSGLGRRQTQNAGAYDAWLRGRDQAHRRTAEGNARAIALYQKALALDGDYALAWSDLALTYAAGAINGDARPGDVAPRARMASERAVQANPQLSEAQLAFGYDLWLIEWKWAAAEAALRRGIDLDPSNAPGHRVLGHALSQAGRHREAEAAMRLARELDPLDAINRAISSQVAFQARDIPAATEHARRAIALDPSLWIGYVELAQALEGAGEHALALEALADLEKLGSDNSKQLSLRGYILARMGRMDAAREALGLLDAAARDRYVPPYAQALIYAGLGDREAMFNALELAYAARDVHLMYLPVDMKWDPYRAEPRFAELTARCGFTPGRSLPR